MATKYRIEYISTFQTDVLVVAWYLKEYPKKAARIFAKVDKAISILSEMPEIHPVYDDMPTFRFIVVEDYLVFYKTKKQDRIVEIHRLLHGRMDISAHLQ